MNRMVGADRLAGQLGTAIRDHLVGIHVRAGAGAGLKDVDRELGVPRADTDFGSGLGDEINTGGVEFA